MHHPVIAAMTGFRHSATRLNARCRSHDQIEQALALGRHLRRRRRTARRSRHRHQVEPVAEVPPLAADEDRAHRRVAIERLERERHLAPEVGAHRVPLPRAPGGRPRPTPSAIETFSERRSAWLMPSPRLPARGATRGAPSARAAGSRPGPRRASAGLRSSRRRSPRRGGRGGSAGRSRARRRLASISRVDRPAGERLLAMRVLGLLAHARPDVGVHDVGPGDGLARIVVHA